MTQDLQTYLAHRERYLTTPYIINENGAFFECKGLLIPENDFIDMFPLGDRIRTDKGKGDNIGSANI